MVSKAIAKTYKECMDAVHDSEYCAALIGAILEVSARRVFGYVPEGRTKPKFILVLPSDDYTVGIWVDVTKKSAIIRLKAPRHAVNLLYERGEDGGFVLKSAEVLTMEVMASMNGPPKPPGMSEGGGL
jgi:hypothetical protein